MTRNERWEKYREELRAEFLKKEEERAKERQKVLKELAKKGLKGEQ